MAQNPMLPDAGGAIIESARRVGIAVDSCSLLPADFIARHDIAVAQMRLNIAEDEFVDSPDLNYIKIYRCVASDPTTRAWASAPKPDQWYDTIVRAATNFDSVVCLTVAAGLSASYDSARVAAQRFTTENPNVDVRIIDSGTISGALKLLALDMSRAADLGLDADGVTAAIHESKSTLRTIAALDELSRVHLIANTPRLAINAARRLNIKPVVTFAADEFRLVAKPMSMMMARHRMLRAINDDVRGNQARFVVLHVDAKERAESIAADIRSQFDCQFMNISDFHPFTGFYAGRGAIGIAWQRL